MTHQPPSSLKRAITIAIAASFIVGIIMLAFSWPTLTAKVEDLPVGVVGNQQQIAAMQQQVDDRGHTMVLHEEADRGAAVAAIERRDVYGALVFNDNAAPTMLVSSAANPQVAQMLTGMAQQMSDTLTDKAQAGFLQQVPAMAAAGTMPQALPKVTVAVEDVVPLSAEDSRGTGLVAASFPLVLGGMIGAVLISFLIHGSHRRGLAVILYTLGAGIVLDLILQAGFGVLQGNALTNMLAITLSIGAITAVIVGLRGLIGPAGIGVGAILFLFMANPISSATMPKEFIRAPFGTIGQYLPPGASSTLLRDLSYFPHADLATPWVTLGAWAAIGLALIGLALAQENKRLRAAEHVA
ncbi:hypothetical protein [Corynebacterium aquilae]|uniref:hypothetical protein n=1 Tax=Corynebacterium aquilae TaxID=203263 RepID=UPI0009528D97|nr:hypothetical protein [Corynebacterium aquilae]